MSEDSRARGSKDLEQDLTRELEERDNDPTSDTTDEQRAQQSTNASNAPGPSSSAKKIRSRPNAQSEGDPDQEDRPKRRKTTDSENSERISSNDVEDPVPGPSRLREIPVREQDPEEEDSDMDYDEESEKEDLVKAAGTEENVSTSLPLGHQRDEEVSRDRPLRRREESAERLLTSNPRVARSLAMEELFRIPIYENEGEGRRVAPEDRQHGGGIRRYQEDADYQGNQEEEESYEVKDEDAKEPPVNDKNRTLWARKMLFMSTELVFPGFKVTAANIRRQYMAVRVRSSWLLQALLYADLLFFTMWFFAFLSTFDIALGVLKELHGNLVLCMTVLFTVVNIPRLVFGFRGNEQDKLEYLALFWMITFVVQIPLFGFVLFTDIFTPVRLAFTITMDSGIMIFILLEAIVGAWHLKTLVRDELRVIELANKSQNAVAGLHDENLNRQPAVNNNDQQPAGAEVREEIENDDRQIENSDEEWSTDEEDQDVNDLGYRMRIRGLSADNENDDANQVTSTSDAIRHRPIRAT